MYKPDIEAYYRQHDLWELDRYEGNPSERLRARVIASLIDPNVESILDVGCGNGFVTKRLRAKRVVGLDPSEEALAQFDGEAVVGRADDLPFEDRSFDAVVCAEVLEHLSDEVFAKAVRELDRVARRFLVIGVPYRQDLREGMTECADCHTRYHVDHHHRSFRGPEELEVLFPAFEADSVVLLHKRERIRSATFRAIRYWMLGPRASSQFARCPRCGSQNTVKFEQGKGLRGWLLDGLAWRMKKTLIPNWVIMLLERRE